MEAAERADYLRERIAYHQQRADNLLAPTTRLHDPKEDSARATAHAALANSMLAELRLVESVKEAAERMLHRQAKAGG